MTGSDFIRIYFLYNLRHFCIPCLRKRKMKIRMKKKFSCTAGVCLIILLSVLALSGCSSAKPDKVTSSLKEGSYDSSQTVELTSEGSDLILYTTDGTIPDKDNNTALIYKDGIKIDKTTVINTAAYKGDTASDIASYKFEINIPPAAASTAAENSTASAFEETTSADTSTGTAATDNSDPNAEAMYDRPSDDYSAFVGDWVNPKGGGELTIRSDGSVDYYGHSYPAGGSYVNGTFYPQEASHGFALWSNGDGTISVDNSTYVPADGVD